MVSVNERTPRPRRERVRSLGRGRPVVLWAGLAGVLVGMASAQEPESQLDLRDALRRAREKAASIKERVDAARDNPIVTYPSDLMEEIATFYREGVKDENAAAAAKVNQLYVKEWVLALYRDMFALNRDAQAYPENELVENEVRLLTFLTRVDARRFRTHLTDVLDSARDDLLPDQRMRLYRLLGRTMTPEDGPALKLLHDYAKRDETPPDEWRRIVEAIANIEKSGTSVDE